jgi:DNA invertase Pin-like site-specific DNA recombinase
MGTNWEVEGTQSASSRRVHGYVRVSTREQAGDDRLSLSLQQEEIRKLAASQYPDRELILWSDPAQSAWSIPLGQRKAGRAMLEALQPGDLIVSTKFDRLFRSMQDTHNQIAEFHANGIDLVILQFGREPIGNSVMGKAMVTLFALIAELEGDFIRQRTADGRAAKMARGGFVGGTVPIGWRKVGAGREARLVEDEREQAMLKLARDLRAKGETFAATAEQLNQRGYRSRTGTLIIASQVHQWIRERSNKRPETASERIREGLAKRKAKGLPLGNPRVHEISSLGVAKNKARAAAFLREVMPIIEQICVANPLNVTLQSPFENVMDE